MLVYCARLVTVSAPVPLGSAEAQFEEKFDIRHFERFLVKPSKQLLNLGDSLLLARSQVKGAERQGYERCTAAKRTNPTPSKRAILFALAYGSSEGM